MKKSLIGIFLIFLLAGCAETSEELEEGIQLRSKLSRGSGCTFTASVTADYGDKIQKFTLNCRGDAQGNIAFLVQEPSSISGISGNLSGSTGEFTFQDTALCFPLLMDDRLSPISAPWIFLHALSGGYMASGCEENGKIYLSLDDRFEDRPVRLDVWLNGMNEPERAEILYEGRRILHLDVTNFEIL